MTGSIETFSCGFGKDHKHYPRGEAELCDRVLDLEVVAQLVSWLIASGRLGSGVDKELLLRLRGEVIDRHRAKMEGAGP